MSAGPRTGSGQRFRIPGTLTGRPGVWNLGDVLTGKEDVFALSFTENALTPTRHSLPRRSADVPTWSC